MTHREDYIPTKGAEFFNWQDDFVVYVTPRVGTWGIPGTVMTALNAAKTEYVKRYNAAKNPETRTPTAVLMKDEALAAYVKEIRALVRIYLANGPAVTDEDRSNMGLSIHKSTRTPAPVAKNAPACKIDTGTICRLILYFYDEGKEKTKAKPPGQHGVEISWMISDVPVVDADDLVHSAFDTRTPFTLEFQGHERGKTVYLALRWENTRGEKGPWSVVQSAIIP
jgi:hypothetical protein